MRSTHKAARSRPRLEPRSVVVGVDAGASKTVAVAADSRGAVVAREVAGGANMRSAGPEAARANLRAALSAVCAPGHVAAICIGAAGIDRPADRRAFEALAAPLVPAGALLILCHDAKIALRAATGRRPALVVVAGTGSLAYGETAAGAGVRAAGYGALIGDDGSALAIGMRALRHTARALDGVVPSDRMAQETARALGVRSVAQIIARVHRWPPDVALIAGLAPLVAAHYARNAVARRIVDAEARKLGAYALSVARRVRTRAVLCVSLAGGAFEGVAQLGPFVRAAVERSGPCDVSRPVREPALGAVDIALEALGCNSQR